MPVKYEYNGREKYRGIRSNRDEISFDAFTNRVCFDEDKRTINIKVDDYYEYDEDENDDLISENEEDFNGETDEPFTEQDILDSGNDYIYKDIFHLHIPNSSPNDCKINLFSGLNISFPVGEGILDFCYTDFTKELPYLRFISALLKHAKDIEIPEFHNRDEIFEFEQDRVERTMTMIGKYIYQSLYSGIFPPFIEQNSSKALKYYRLYIDNIQQEMKRRIEFVFDEEFYPYELSRLKAYERFSLYCEAYDIPKSFERTERFSVKVTSDATTLASTRMPMEEIINRLQSHVPTEKESPLEKELNLEAGMVDLIYHVPHFLAIGYDCCTVHDMLELEFSKMLEYGIRLHKCKNCGRYFIVKGNYEAEYCDRIREGQTKNCQQIAAQKKYSEKLHNNEAIALFRKYYKRYYARSKVGTIKPDKFRKWNYRACEMRDKCLNGEISAKEFENWLNESFTNRNKN